MRRILSSLVAAFLLAAPLAAAPPSELRIAAWFDGPVTAGTLTAFLSGQKARVTSVQGPADDLVVLLVMDVVGDLAQAGPAKQALVQETEGCPPNTWFAVLRAQDGLRPILDPTGDRPEIAAAINDLPVAGKAGLLETIDEALRVADSILLKTRVRVAVLFVTDSEIGNYREDFTNPVINSSDSHDLSRRFPEALVREKIEKLDRRLAARQTPVFIAHVNYRTDRLNEAYQNGLTRLAKTTGGDSNFARSIGDIPANLHTLFSRICSHYSVTVELPQSVKPVMDIRLALAGGASPPGHRSRFALK